MSSVPSTRWDSLFTLHSYTVFSILFSAAIAFGGTPASLQASTPVEDHTVPDLAYENVSAEDEALRCRVSYGLVSVSCWFCDCKALLREAKE